MLEEPIYYYPLLQCSHTVETRGIQVIIENAQAFLEKGFPDRRTQIGFYQYVHCLVSTLRGHFQTEEEVIHPFFQERIPTLRLGVILEQHQQMLPHIETIEATLEGINSQKPYEALKKLIDSSNKLNVLWSMHISTEESCFTSDSITMQQLTQAEQIELCKESGKFNRELHESNPWVVAFMLYNLPVEQRKIMSRNMPRIIVEKLVPTVWKDEWSPMKPFLLET